MSTLGEKTMLWRIGRTDRVPPTSGDLHVYGAGRLGQVRAAARN